MAAFAEKAPFSLRTLPGLLLFSVQLSQALPVPGGSPGEKNAQLVQVNGLSGRSGRTGWFLGNCVACFFFLVKSA